VDELDFGVLLGLAYQAFVGDLREHLAGKGFDDLGRHDGYVFRLLAERSVTVSELATRLDMTKQGAGQVVDDMEQRGYVERTPHPTDARARHVRLSRRGRAALRTARDFHRAFERALSRRLGADAARAARAVLDDIARRGEGDAVPLRPM
jgi:DNA-binding MarR family transcriptional regulator